MTPSSLSPSPLPPDNSPSEPANTSAPGPESATTSAPAPAPVPPPAPIVIAPMANPILMPSRGDHSAPKFDPKQPCELRRYFNDLDFMFTRAGVTDRTKMKQHVCHYVDVNTTELWETLTEYMDLTKTYEEFETTVYALYPGSDEERKWSVADMDKLVSKWMCIGIISLGDLGEYYQQFLAITKFLISRG